VKISELIQDYRRRIGPCKDNDLAWIRERGSLAEAIEFATMARTRQGKRHPHQWRLRASAMKQGRDRLLGNQKALRRCRTFDDLLRLVEDLVLSIPGLGELYAYDTAVKIGVYLGILPERVYLHAGVRDGRRCSGSIRAADRSR